MSHWDADRQQWTVDPQQGPQKGGAELAGPSRTTVLTGALVGIVLVGGIGLGIWSLLRDDGSGSDDHHMPPPGYSAPPYSTGTAYPTYGYPTYGYPTYGYPTYPAYPTYPDSLTGGFTYPMPAPSGG